MEPLAGDIVLCVPLIAREARQQRKRIDAHFAHLIVHGMLHLQGYDHENDKDARIMEALEAEIVVKLGYADPYEYR
jgi:probable rRNA maturation factor